MSLTDRNVLRWSLDRKPPTYVVMLLVTIRSDPNPQSQDHGGNNLLLNPIGQIIPRDIIRHVILDVF